MKVDNSCYALPLDEASFGHAPSGNRDAITIDEGGRKDEEDYRLCSSYRLVVSGL